MMSNAGEPDREKPLEELGLEDLDPRLREAFEASWERNKELLMELARR